MSSVLRTITRVVERFQSSPSDSAAAMVTGCLYPASRGVVNHGRIINESRFFVSVIDDLESTIRPQQDQGALTKQAIARSDHCGFCFLLLIGEGNRRILVKRSSLIGRKTPTSALDPDPPPTPLTRFCFAGFSTPIRESSGVPSFATQKVSERREGPTTTIIIIMKRKLVDENSSTECGHYSPKGLKGDCVDLGQDMFRIS